MFDRLERLNLFEDFKLLGFKIEGGLFPATDVSGKVSVLP
jgi:hypothetical protein